MATLENKKTGLSVPLASSTLIGRERGNFLALTQDWVSSSHARIFWTDRGWRCRDLGSRNGTFLAGARLPPGEDFALPLGAQISFGKLVDPWVVTSISPPDAIALNLANRSLVLASAGMLSLPEGADPEITVLADSAGAWMMESEGEGRAVSDQQIVNVGGASYRLYLPEYREGTLAPETSLVRLQLVAIRFRVSKDQDHVDVLLVWEKEQRLLEPRAFHYMLLILAQLRLADAEHPPSERGWVYPDDLARMVRVPPKTLNVHLFRARKQLADTGVAGAGNLIERRTGTQQVRLNISDIEIVQLD